MKDVSTLVARQYEAFAYPQPFADLAEEISNGYSQVGDPSLYGPVLWPEGRPPGRLKILAAGCGTIQAAYAAFMNREDEVVGVDLSDASLGHERYLQERHGLSNLRLFKGDLIDVAATGQDFDVILCTGVLHHMADPGAGLAALRDVLAPGGVMVLMLYGQTVRTGVYMLQDAFRRIGIEQTTAGVAQVRRILKELPQRHYANDYVRAADELKHDTAVVDTFLHPQDRAYTVPQIFDLVEDAGLQFQNWVDNYLYWRNGAWGAGTAIADAVDPLPPREHWAAIEMLRQSAGMHTFTVRGVDTDLAIVDFDQGDWRGFVPHRGPGLFRKGPALFQRGYYQLKALDLEEFVIEAVDGRRSIGDIIGLPALADIPREERDLFGQRYFEHLWKLGHVMIALPPR
ncbi:class I SAM-dependent methyltransferase [Sphingomonas lutea]|uniref:Class I SAM-dependent methyltransferase n=1 Tax=Sphingomonas lutea TaxID=1045317 RepID=A0A7G9SFA2_9SPHN|nr:class I SAM-dependent methyltransferase [Sphingomonas lutea]QNN66527.1 class I SAM-dependent methyltransferase [Sphingomonas lutea]